MVGRESAATRPRAAVGWDWTSDLGCLTIILGFFGLRLLTAAFLGFGVDESYSLSISRDLSLSYFDHPPLHQWITHYAEALLGLTHSVRIPFILMFGFSGWAMFLLTRRLFGRTAAFWAVLALNLSGFFSFSAGSWVLPDGPLTLALLACAATLARVLFPNEAEQRASWRHWLLVGFWLGMALLSKYQALLFAIGCGLSLWSLARGRAALRGPGPYLAILVALAVFAPVIIWNAQHDWASIAFQSARRGAAHGLRPSAVLTALGGEMALLLPWLFLPLSLGAIRAARRGPGDGEAWLCLMLAAPTIVVFSLIPMLGAPGLPHWSMSGWLMLFPLLGRMLAKAAEKRTWPRKWAVGSGLALLGLWAFATSDALTAWPLRTFPTTFKTDPTVELMDWVPLRTELARRGLLSNRTAFVVTLNWMEAGKIDTALQGNTPILLFAKDARQYAYRERAGGTIGEDALIIGSPKNVARQLSAVLPLFQSIEQLPSVFLGRGGTSEIELEVFRAHQMAKLYVP